jgi:transposase
MVFTTLAGVVSEPPDGNSSPIRMTMKEETNTSIDFIRFCLSLFESGAITKGDILILDNAKIHTSSATFIVLYALAQAVGARIGFQPNYSPELSPAELVHAYAKHIIRTNRTSEQLWECIIAAHALITQQMMVNFYLKCVQ